MAMPGTPQQNGPAESAIWRVNKALFTRVPGFGRDGERLWLESCHWAAGGFNRSPTKANVGYKSPHELFTGRPPPLQIVPFLQPGYMRVMRARKMDPQVMLCCYLNNGDNHHESVVKVLKFATGRVCMTNNVVWVSDRAPLLTPPLENVAAAPFLIEYISPPLMPPSPFARYPTAPAAISSQAPPATSTPPSPAAPSTAATPSPTVTAPPATPPATPHFTTTAPPATSFAVVRPPPAVAPPGAAPSTNMLPLTTRTICELDVGRGDMRVSGRTRAVAMDQGGGRASSMPPLSARANRELDLGRETRVPGRLRGRRVRFQDGGAERSTSPGGSGDALAHRFGLVSLQDKATLLSTLTTRSIVDGGRKEIPSSAGGRDGAEPGGREREGTKTEGLREEVPFACATLLASREDIDRAMRDLDPPEVAPDLPQLTSGLRRRSCGGCISWFSRTQKCVTLSMTEAEYVSLADVMKEVLFLRQVWRFMLPEAGMPCIPVLEDNQGAIQLAQNPISNGNSKHIDVRPHFIRELVGRKEISIIHVESAYQHADFLTKALHVGDFEFHRNFVMSVRQER
ncbi:unnamed protein product [Ectocarpus sp. CCAP 1310/34]|nr:unnamed protein product [Ectocarpus sp. CCAP 1310/34]